MQYKSDFLFEICSRVLIYKAKPINFGALFERYRINGSNKYYNPVELKTVIHFIQIYVLSTQFIKLSRKGTDYEASLDVGFFFTTTYILITVNIGKLKIFSFLNLVTKLTDETLFQHSSFLHFNPSIMTSNELASKVPLVVFWRTVDFKYTNGDKFNCYNKFRNTFTSSYSDSLNHLHHEKKVNFDIFLLGKFVMNKTLMIYGKKQFLFIVMH